jgi:hypothetical protein
MIEELVEHLYKDPEAQDDNAILRFLLLEWRDLKTNLYKNEPLARVKMRLLELDKVRYIRLNDSTNQHEYWRDYSTEGRRALQAHAESEPEQPPTGTLEAQDLTHDQEQPSRVSSTTTSTRTMASIVAVTNRSTRTDTTVEDTVTLGPSNVVVVPLVRGDDKESTADDKEHDTTIILDTQQDTTTVVVNDHHTGGVDNYTQDGTTPPSAHTTTPSEFRQMLNLLPEPTPTLAPTPTTPQKVSPQNYSESDPYTSDYILTEMLNPYTGKQVTVRATPPRATRYTTLLQTEIEDNTHKQDDDGFFIPVPPRKKNKKKSLDINIATHTHMTPHQPTTHHTVTRTSGGPYQYQTTEGFWEAGVEETKEDFTSNDAKTQEQELPDTTIATSTPDTTKDPETLVQALNTVLQYKIQEAVRTLDTHQKAWISMIGYREEHHRAKMRELEDKMRDYEENTKKRLQLEVKTSLDTMDQAARAISKRTMTHITEQLFQKERATQSWMQVEAAKTLETLAHDLATHQAKHKAHVEEFCTEELDALQSHLDSYKTHVTTIHDELRLQCPPIPTNRYSQTIPDTEQEDTEQEDSSNSPTPGGTPDFTQHSTQPTNQDNMQPTSHCQCGTTLRTSAPWKLSHAHLPPKTKNIYKPKLGSHIERLLGNSSMLWWWHAPTSLSQQQNCHNMQPPPQLNIIKQPNKYLPT